MGEQNEQGSGGHVRRRQVFYVPGYDPIHPRRYRELYRTESRAQAVISGYEIDQRAAEAGAQFGWQVTARIEGERVEAAVEVLVWSDIVRGSMNPGILGTYVLMFRTVLAYIGTGAFLRLIRLRKGPVIAALYPIGMLIVQAAVAVAAGYGMGLLAGMLHPVAGWAAGLGLGYAILWWFKRRDDKLFVYYLMHDYAYSARSLGANPPALEARIAQFADRIAEALGSDADEVLVVGHSSGAHIAVSVLADLVRSGRVPADGPALGFLTLGHVVPMVSFLPRAARLRADLAYLSTRDALFWLDVTAPGDGCTFALCDPVAVSGVAPKGKRWPIVISAAFTQTLSPARWKALRWRFFRLHFQYLCAFDRPGDYDYFRITAGPMTLADRFGDRSASASRIETPLSPYRSMAAA